MHRYRAFISYSHAADNRLAPALQSALIRFAKPWYRLRALSIYRDKTNLAVTPTLWGTIEEALSDSDYFLLLASPEAASSKWVKQEVQWWLDHRSASTLFIVLTDGELVWDTVRNDFDWTVTTALPEVLRGQFEEEPLYVDLRWARSADDLSLRNSRFADAVLDLAAPLHGIDKADLASEEVRQHRRTVGLAWLVVAIICVVAVVAVWQAVVATQQRNIAERNFRTALSRQLGAQALNLAESQYDLALLLAVEATRLRDTAESYGSLLTLLDSNPKLSSYLRLQDHTSAVVALSPDGDTLAYTAGCHTIVLLDMARQVPLKRLESTRIGWATHLAFSPDGKNLAIGDSEGRVHQWRGATEASTKELTDEPIVFGSSAVTGVAYSKDGRVLAAIHDNSGSISLWRLSDRTLISRIESAHSGEVLDIEFGRDGTLLASAGGDGQVRLWDVSQIDRPVELHAMKLYGTAWTVAFSPDGRKLATGGANRDHLVHIWDISEPAQPHAVGPPVESHGDGVFEVVFDPTGRILASGGREGVIILWDPDTGRPRDTSLVGHSDWIRLLAFTPDGTSMVSGGSGEILLWDLSVDQRLAMPLTEYPPQSVNGLDFAPPAGRFLATSGADNTVRLWDLPNRRHLASLPISGGGWQIVHDVAFSPDGRFLAYGDCQNRGRCEEGLIRLWDVEGDQLTGEPLRGHQATVYSLAYSRPDGLTLVSGDNNGAVGFWDMSDPRSPKPIRGPTKRHHAIVDSLAFSSDGRTLASSDSTGQLLLWDLNKRMSPQVLVEAPREHANAVTSLAFHPHGEILASGSGDRSILLWDVENPSDPQPIDRLTGPTDWITTITFHPDGRLLASSGYGGDIWLWDVERRRLFAAPLEFHTQKVNALGFTPDGQTLVSGSHDGRIALWDFSLNSWRARACAIANRTLTDAEWRAYVGIERDHEPCNTIP